MKLDVIVDAQRRADNLLQAPDCVTEVTGVTDDSRRVEAGSLFCAIDGVVQDGHAYVVDAEHNGAAAVLVARYCNVSVPEVLVKDSRLGAGIAAREWYGRPAEDLSLIGVTGTNGKSTTVSIIRHLLNATEKAASIGTLGAIDGLGENLEGYGSLTTPGPVEFQAVLAKLASEGVTTVALEASSHGLHQRRLDAVTFEVGVYTNLTHEHLDYHKDLESYAAAKMRLSTLLGADGVEVINSDDPVWSAMPRRRSIRRIAYGRGADAELQAFDEVHSAGGSESTFRFGNEQHRVKVPLIGEYNVTNALAAAGAAWAMGMEPEEIVVRIASSPQVPGRMERLATAGFSVLRDYAHTPDGFERAIRAVRSITRGKLIVLFGCGGDRDRDKRAEMGNIAAQGSDLVVIAMDNPRTEDPDRILDDIEVGIGASPHMRIMDREVAIRTAISLLSSGDCLLLLGKGHETYQIVGTEKHPFDEPRIVRSAVEALQ